MAITSSRVPRGLGSGSMGYSTATPSSPESGGGGAGKLNVGPLNFSPAVGEIGSITTGRITLAMLNFTILSMVGFYVWTRSAQGGG